MGAEAKLPPRRAVVDTQLDGHEWCIIHRDAALLHRSDEEVFFALPLENGSKQFDQRGPADRSALVEPRTVGRDPHVDVAAKGRIPQVDRRRPLAGRGFHSARNAFEPVLATLPFLRHGWLYCRRMRGTVDGRAAGRSRKYVSAESRYSAKTIAITAK